jgi:hypothetical protein
MLQPETFAVLMFGYVTYVVLCHGEYISPAVCQLQNYSNKQNNKN